MLPRQPTGARPGTGSAGVTPHRRRLVGVGGFRLYVESAGRGSPAVVLEAGGGTASDTWDPVWSAVAALTRVVRYDRAGLGSSEPRPAPWTLRGMAAELRAMLEGARLEPPYVLVGHSFGAQVVRVFAGTYPADVAGLVLVDGAQEDLDERIAPFLTEDGRRRWRRGWDDWLATANPEAVAFARLPEAQEGLRAEGRRLPDAPLVVLTAASRDARDALGLDWVPVDAFLRATREIDAGIAALSPRGRHVLAERSGHMVHHDEPALVVAVIRDVVEAARTGGP